MNRYEEDQHNGSLIDTKKTAGSVMEYQTVVAVGQNSAGIKVGDVVMINPTRYAVMKHERNSLKDGVFEDNPVVGYNLPVITIGGVDHLLLESSDVDFIIEEYEEESPEARAARSGIYAPGTSVLN